MVQGPSCSQGLTEPAPGRWLYRDSPVRTGMCPRAGQRGQRWLLPRDDFALPGLALCLRLLHRDTPE